MRSPVAVILVISALVLAGCAAPAGGDDGAMAGDDIDVAATATTGVIRGIVMDEGLRPLQGAVVTLMDGQSAVTGEFGGFGFEGVQPGISFLRVSRRGFADTQQSVEVVAGVDEPPYARILLRAIDLGIPAIDAFHTKLLVGFRLCLGGGGCGLGPSATDNPGGIFGQTSREVRVPLKPNATVAQTEAHWKATTPFSQYGILSCYSRAGNETVEGDGVSGETPIVNLIPASKGSGDERLAGDQYTCGWMPQQGGIAPIGAAYGQVIDAFTHVFYHFLPDEGWQFGRDGEHPLPPSCTPGAC